MQIVLASYFQPENHGPGRKIGITHDRPQKLDEEVDYECTQTYQALAPDKYSMIEYYVERNKIKKEAGGWNFDDEQQERFDEIGKVFQDAYREKLQSFVDEVNKQASDSDKTVFEIVGLEDGDTLLSLEKAGNKSYRSMTAEYLRKLGYNVRES